MPQTIPLTRVLQTPEPTGLRDQLAASRAATGRHITLSRELAEVEQTLATISTAMNHRANADAEAADAMILARIRRAGRRAIAAADAYEASHHGRRAK